MNLARDQLRRRRRRTWIGPWLPSPVETGVAAFEPPASEGRYDLLESCTFAFLLALEALTPQQRAVLLLREVFDYSVAETATALDLSAANVKTTHHRARRAMTRYDAHRRPPTRDLQETTRHALSRFMGALLHGDPGTIEAVLAPGTLSPTAAASSTPPASCPSARPRGPLLPPPGRATRAPTSARRACRTTASRAGVRSGSLKTGYTRRDPVEVGDDGLVRCVQSVLATRKLTAALPIGSE